MLWKFLRRLRVDEEEAQKHIPHSTFHIPPSTFHLPAFWPIFCDFTLTSSNRWYKNKPPSTGRYHFNKRKIFFFDRPFKIFFPQILWLVSTFRRASLSHERHTLADWGRRVALGIYYYFEGSASFHIEIQPWYDGVYLDWERGDMKWEDSFKEVRELITNRYDYIYFDWTHRQEDQKSTWSA